MVTLCDIQDKFSRAILGAQNEIVMNEIVMTEIIAGEITGEGDLALGLTPQARINIYRNNSFITLSRALAKNFPVLCRLVGQNFFDHLAEKYVEKYPPVTPLLMSYGANMPEFLKGFDAVKDLSYLADVARLEHLWTMSFNGPDATGFDLGLISKMDPERFDDLIFKFLPNMQLMSSVFPILDIWLANQEGAQKSEDIDLDSGPCYLVIFRKAQVVEIMTLDLANYTFFEFLGSGETLSCAAEKVTTKYPGFNLQAAMNNIVQNSMIEHFECAKN